MYENTLCKTVRKAEKRKMSKRYEQELAESKMADN
jgi:hypothetical protein